MIGPILAILILGGFLASLIPAWRRSRQEDRELEQRIRCGPGCICAGENVRARQPITAQAPQPTALIIQQPAPQIIVIQQPAPQMMYQPQQQPQIIYLPAPQTPQYLPAPKSANLPTYPQTPTYQPRPKSTSSSIEDEVRYAPQSYYPGYSPEPDPRVHYLPPSQPIGQLPPARASDIEEARRRFERECEEMRRR